MKQGEPIQFELVSPDVSGGAQLVIREDGAAAARTLAADERIIIDAFTAHVEAGVGASPVYIFAGANNSLAAHELMAVLSDGPNSVSDLNSSGTKGIIPWVLATGGGNMAIAGTGRIVKG